SAQPIENFIPIYRRAKTEGLKLKAHVGEWGTAEDVRRAVECLELDEVQHGIAAVNDPSVVRFLVDNKIRLNITPSSNYLLGRVKDMKAHPIAELYRSGVDVTINSDDVLIFDSDVSKEYLRLYRCGCLTADELDDIRKKGLKHA
ncbi:MAG: adenosine deaminase, partial [Butyrivibrio sp.]|nr:adenosine deaminase [Butyrivibrio sp.]